MDTSSTIKIIHAGLLMLGLISGPAPAEFRWSELTEDVGIAESIGDAQPQVSLERYSGRPIVAWYSGPNQNDRYPIKVANLKNGYWQVREIAGSINIDSRPLQIAHWNEGTEKAMVGWTSADNEELFVSSSLYDYSSDFWTDPAYKKIGNNFNYWGAPPEFSLISEGIGNGAIHAVWLQQKNSMGLGPQLLRTSRYVRNRWKPVFTLARRVNQFSLATGWDDVATVVWINSKNHKIMSRQLKGGAWRVMKTVSEGPPPGNYFDRNPSVALAGDGLATAVWERETPDGWQVLVSQQMAGGKWSKETVLTEGHDGYGARPQVATSPQGKVTVIWLEDNDDAYGGKLIKARQSDNPGIWTETSVIAKGAPSFVKLVMDGFANAIVVWNEPAIIDGKSTWAILSTTTADGKWDQPVTLCKDCVYPSISASNQGTTRIVWINWDKTVQSKAGYIVAD